MREPTSYQVAPLAAQVEKAYDRALDLHLEAEEYQREEPGTPEARKAITRARAAWADYHRLELLLNGSTD